MSTIKIGQVYMARCTKTEIPVRLERANPDGGWTARAMTHGRVLQIKDETQLLYLCSENEVRGIAQGVMPHRRSKIQGPVYREPMALGTEEKRPAQKVIRPKPKQVVIILRMSLLDAANQVLSETKKAMTTREIIAACAEKQYWTSSAMTPWATLNAALNRDIAANGAKSRFRKMERGKYSAQ